MACRDVLDSLENQCRTPPPHTIYFWHEVMCAVSMEHLCSECVVNYNQLSTIQGLKCSLWTTHFPCTLSPPPAPTLSSLGGPWKLDIKSNKSNSEWIHWLMPGASALGCCGFHDPLFAPLSLPLAACTLRDSIRRELNVTNYFRQLVSVGNWNKTKPFTQTPVLWLPTKPWVVLIWMHSTKPGCSSLPPSDWHLHCVPSPLCSFVCEEGSRGRLACPQPCIRLTRTCMQLHFLG